MTSNFDATNSTYLILMTTICHWMKKPPWEFSACATDNEQQKKKILKNLSKVRVYIYAKNDLDMPVCVLCQKTLGNNSIRQSLLTWHLKRTYPQFKDLTFSSIEKQCLSNNACTKLGCVSNTPMPQWKYLMKFLHDCQANESVRASWV